MTPASPVPPAPPTATYRIQLHPGHPFAAAEADVPALAALGVSHLHLSPVLEAVPGSTHGYDVTDPTRVRAELGGDAGLRSLSRAARAHGMGLVVDIVPNHMAADPVHNQSLRTVLRDGPHSPYAAWFDIDWAGGGGQLLLPVLGERAGVAAAGMRVEDGELLLPGGLALPLRAGTEGLPLPELLDAQWYRPVWWRLARTELNYRRFFTVNDLIAVRVEDPAVFEATHATVLTLLDEGVVHGLRVDHPDGLTDPGAYLARLRERSGGRWTVVEKILADGEPLPPSWPVAGTTGYDALRHVDAVLTDPEGARTLVEQYRAFADPEPEEGGEWHATARRAARQVAGHDLAAEVETLVRIATRVCASGLGLRDHAPWALRTAVRELLVRVPVYRPYPEQSPAETAAVLTERAAEEARAAFDVPEEAHAVDVVRGLASGTLTGLSDTAGAAAFRARFAQVASALHAKAVEDRAFYRYVPLLSACEVGGDPGGPALAPEAFHAFCARLQRDWPETGTVLSTHDTKRSADARARIAVLAEFPRLWGEFLTGAVRRAGKDAAAAVGLPFTWAAWQTACALLPEDGTPPSESAGSYTDRLTGALLKHAREAGLHTTWTEQDPAYEEAVERYVREGLTGTAADQLPALAERLGPHVRARVLAAALLHLTMPGVPDVYQGTERDLRTLMDPDNRRPVPSPDTALRTLGSGGRPTSLDEEKLALTATALRLRRSRPDLFGAASDYHPLAARGPAAAHCLAFGRGPGEAPQLLTAVTRLPGALHQAGGWQGTTLPLPPGRYTDLLTGADPHHPTSSHEGEADLTALFAHRPVALLRREEE
ncbi:malto-oligosyltrehalose synthase [Streptomyces koyangensis]|uniref:malto-oligosyltrehalose synthase n=1 Tax=Streptomyces koyangensis TaxID=188770 RepID=UPI00364F44A7